MSLSELRTKDVVNTLDGRRLGKVMEIEFDERDGRVEALVVPRGRGGFLGLFRPSREGCPIDWQRVRRIGDDVILVEVETERFDA